MLLAGSLLATNLTKAAEMALKQRQAANEFSGTFPHETVQSWTKMVKDWENDHSRPNPYISKERGTFLNSISWLKSHNNLPASKISEVRLRLSQEEVTGAEHGQHAPHRVSASVFVRMGLELEDQQ